MVDASTTSISPRDPSIRPTSNNSGDSPDQAVAGASSGQAKEDTQWGWISTNPFPPKEGKQMLTSCYLILKNNSENKNKCYLILILKAVPNFIIAH